MRARGDSRDHHTFNHRVWVVLKNQTVFTGARFALISIAQNVFWFRGLLGHERPFHPSVESSPPAAAQAGILHQIDNLIRLHSKRFLDGFIAVELTVAIDISRTLAKAFGDDLHFVGMGNQVSHFSESMTQ